MNRSAKIYVAGHTGLVGSAILRRLKNLKYRNIVLRDINKLDLARQSETEEFFKNEKPDYVFLAAAKVGGIQANNLYKGDFIYENMMIALNIIHSSYKYGVKKLLNLGSSCIYPKLAPQPLKEKYLLSGKLEPTNEPYAIAKISAIKLCKYYNEQYGTNFISIMPTNLYGKNDNFNLETSHVLPAILRKIHLAKLLQEEDFKNMRKDFETFGIAGYSKNQKQTKKESLIKILNKYKINQTNVTLWGTGLPYREFLYVDDLAEACVFLMKNYNAVDIGEHINIGTGTDLRLKELATLINKIVGYTGKIKWESSKPDGTPKKLLDVTRIQKLGWRPKVELKQGINIIYKYYLSKCDIEEQ